MCRDRHDLGLAVALDQSKHGHLAGSAPAAFAFPGAAKRRFIKFHHTLERRLQLLRHRAARAHQPVEPLPVAAVVPLRKRCRSASPSDPSASTQTGREWVRARVCQSGYLSVVAVTLKKKTK